MDPSELQALLRYHASAIVEVIDDGGIRPSQFRRLILTVQRMQGLVNELATEAPSSAKDAER